MSPNTDSVCGINYNGTSYFFLKNLQGDVIAITDTNGDTVATYSYDAWGKCTVGSDSQDIAYINRFRYRGYYYDTETGLYYLQSRYYDPETGRFINGDSPEWGDKGYIHITICDGLEYDKDYFNEAVFGAAVQYCARLCRKFSLISEQIITDKTAYDLGYASQYSDFESWLTANGKTIDDFRKAVRKLRRKEWLLFDGGLGKDEYIEEEKRYLLENPTFVFLRKIRKLIFIAFKELFAKK